MIVYSIISTQRTEQNASVGLQNEKTSMIRKFSTNDDLLKIETQDLNAINFKLFIIFLNSFINDYLQIDTGRARETYPHEMISEL